MTLLDQPHLRDFLCELYAEAKDTDAITQAEERALESSGQQGDRAKLEAIWERSYLTLAPEVGRLVYLLVRSRRPALVVEFGTSFGISGIHIAAALHDNGSGRLITTELSVNKAKRAAKNFEQAGLTKWVEVRQGDAFQTLAGISGIDLLLLDGWKPLYYPMLKQLEPVLSPGCLVLADDVIGMADEMQDYLDYVRNPANGYVSCLIPLDDGMELSIR
ncbi:MAG TPA: class I SAM-dependent methyltransferase [Terriglobales bacterium]|nr:class I SAM-dependent methyltransferase [Terriglobales bacterium]